MDFTKIDYLFLGNERQRQAWKVLYEHRVLERLHPYDPILVGTIPLAIDLEHSDLDILCCFASPQTFMNDITTAFGKAEGFISFLQKVNGISTVMAQFLLDGFPFELFGQATPTREQAGYRHLLTEYALLQQHGEPLRAEVIRLKRAGHPTEPAFALALNLPGDPYEALL